MIAISSTFCSIFLTLTDFTLHFSRCFTTLLHSDFILLLNSFYTAGKVLLKRFTLMALLWKCGGFWGENILGRDMESDLFNIYSQLFGYNSPKKNYAKEVPLFHLIGVIHLRINMLGMVKLRVELHVIPPIIPP